MKLASIEQVISVEKHSNADALDIVGVLGYKCIVKRDQYKVGDIVVFIQPDSVLPDVPWAAFYKAKSSRVRAIKLRGQWSFGVVESLTNLGIDKLTNQLGIDSIPIGQEVAEYLGITKYDPPLPQDLSAAGVYGNGIPKTDEENHRNIMDLPFGERVDVALKVDGSSWSAFYTLPTPVSEATKGVGGRSFVYKPESDNNYTKNEKKYNVLAKLEAFCKEKNVSLCIRGEQYGHGIQKGSHNPHAQKPLDLAFFSTYLVDEHRYARRGDPFYIFDIAPLLGLPTVPMLEKDVILTPELIKKYAEDLDKVNGVAFEGVVINWSSGSFKVINLHYDSRK